MTQDKDEVQELWEEIDKEETSQEELERMKKCAEDEEE